MVAVPRRARRGPEAPPTSSLPPLPPPAARGTLVVVDGEHYPPVLRAGIDHLHATGHRVIGAVLVGGSEKLGPGEVPDLGVEVVTGPDALGALSAALERFSPGEVVDLSDPPVLDARTRMRLAAHALIRGVPYRGAGFAFDPPPREPLARKPSLAVVGTGKRTGKTAISAAVARTLLRAGRGPVVVAMGRGGPADPELVEPGAFDLSPEGLLALADAGRHAASDHLETALTSSVVTIGTRRCGGGLAGAPGPSTFARGVALANERPEPLMILEGSGTAIPPVRADATICVVPADADPELVTGYLGAYALLLSDLVVVTLPDDPPSRPGDVRSLALLEERVGEVAPEAPVLRTVLRPWPLRPVADRPVFFATTAPEPVAARLASHLEAQHCATVVGWSSQLANRPRLTEDLARAPGAEVLVTELKAAAVDVATRVALERGMEVVYCDNRPVPGEPFERAVEALADVAQARFRGSDR
ncbi:MAG: 2,3-diphosphoglycerate synthetase [Acidimicrobiia bacterium]|nr:2,3-diphosphoglycerate synthetase [Acidimicrobiia bacterium]